MGHLVSPAATVCRSLQIMAATRVVPLSFRSVSVGGRFRTLAGTDNSQHFGRSNSRGSITMRKSITRTRSKPSSCELCGTPLETAATAQNPSATITANSLARCPSCMVLFVIGADRRPIPPHFSDDEDAFDAAMNANPQVKEWAINTLGTAGIRAVAEIKAECVVARERLIVRGDPDLVDDLATLEAYVAGFNEKGITSATPAVRFRASSILAQMRRQTTH